MAYLPLIMGVRWLDKSTHISPFTRHRTWSSQCLEGTGKFVSAKASSIILVSFRSLPHGRRQAAPLKSPATRSTSSSSITARIVNSNFYPIPRFLTYWLLMCKDITVKNDLPWRGGRRNDAREMTPCRTHPDCPSFTTWCCASLVSWRYTEETLIFWVKPC